MLIVTGFALAVVFVGLALILNSVIYTENIATRAESTTSEPLSLTQATERGTADLVGYINEHNTSEEGDYQALSENLTRAFENLSDVTARHHLGSGEVTSLDLGGQMEATWVTQTNRDRAFENEDGNATWEPVRTNADGVRQFRMNVSDTTALDGLAGDPFTVTLNDSANDVWTIQVGETEVEMTDASGDTVTCGGVDTLSDFWVNVSAGTVAGSECPGLELAPELGPVQAVEFEHGDNIEGTYRLLVNKSEADVGSNGDYGLDTSGPYTQAALWGTVVEIDFERQNLVYRTEVRVIPGDDSE
jgi:hypothetical protein